MKFIKFGNAESDGASTIYPVSNIEYIVLYDEVFIAPDDGCEYDHPDIKILLFLKGEDRGIRECFSYDADIDAPIAQAAARRRFDELLEQLNA